MRHDRFLKYTAFSRVIVPDTFFPNGLPAGVTNLDPVTLRLLNLPGSQCPGFGDTFCIPSLAGTPGVNAAGAPTVARLVRAGLGTYEDDQWVLSTDHQLTNNNKLTFRYFNDKNALVQPFLSGSTLPQPRTTPGTISLPQTRINHT